MNKSTEKRIERVLAIVAEHYERGRQDRCLQWVWRNYIHPEMGISLRTFRDYLTISGYHVNKRRIYKKKSDIEDEMQLKLPLWF